MNVSKNCKNRFEDIVALVMDELDHAAAGELQDHIAQCDKCRAVRDVLLEEEKEVRSGFEALSRSLGQVEQAMLGQQRLQATVSANVSDNHFLKRAKNMIITHKRLSVALSGAGIAAVLGFLLLWGAIDAKPVSAMERMAENIRKAKSFKVTMSGELKFVRVPGSPPGASVMTVTGTHYWLAPKSYRVDVKYFSWMDGPEIVTWQEVTEIFPAGKPGIHIEHMNKKFQREPARLGPVSPLMMLDNLGTFSGQADRNLGTKKINGTKAWGFEIDGKKIDPDSYPGPVEIWLDDESNLPVFICYKVGKSAVVEGMTVRLDNFQWNIDLDPKLFLAEAPAGYVEEHRKAPEPKKVLQAITLALKTYAELCGGHYPHIARTFGEPVRDEMYKAAGGTLPLTAEQMMPGKPYHKVSGAFEGFQMFNRVLQSNPDTAYYGKTVGPKDKDKVLLRWKLDDGRYQVIFGDLRTETVTAERLRALDGQ